MDMPPDAGNLWLVRTLEIFLQWCHIFGIDQIEHSEQIHEIVFTVSIDSKATLVYSQKAVGLAVVYPAGIGVIVKKVFQRHNSDVNNPQNQEKIQLYIPNIKP